MFFFVWVVTLTLHDVDLISVFTAAGYKVNDHFETRLNCAIKSK